jgi:hypothetical protein
VKGMFMNFQNFDDFENVDEYGEGVSYIDIYDFDLLHVDGLNIEPFKVQIQYEIYDEGVTHHEYSEEVVPEYHGKYVQLNAAVAAQSVKYRDPETDEVVKEYPTGTRVEDLPGFYVDLWGTIDEFLQRNVD